jgi:hypothetical protein
MGYPTKVQRINRKKSEQWYINFPSAVAQAMEFGRGETVEWFIEDKETLVLQRPEAPQRKLKKLRALSHRRGRSARHLLPPRLRPGTHVAAGRTAPPEPVAFAVAADGDRPDLHLWASV